MSMIASFVKKAPALTRGALANMIEKRAFAAAATGLSNSSVMQKQALTNPAGSVRHAGAGALGCGLALVALGGVAQGIGSVFAALVVGTARNPAIKDDLFAYTIMGFGAVELIMFIVIGLGIMLLSSD